MSDNAGLRNWCFTSYNIEDFVVPDTNKHFRYCVYQVEECPETSQWHIQGYVEFTRTMRMKKIKELFNDSTMHLEPRQGTREQARAYCMKEESRIAEPVELGTWTVTPGKRVDLNVARETILKKRKLDECYADSSLDQITTKYPRWVERIHSTKPVDHQINIQLYPWQEEVFNFLAGAPLHRRIFWIWSSASSTGKTTFRDWVSLQLDVLPASGKLTDILYAYDNNEVVWFDFTRAQEGYESYHTLEELSNIGFKLSTKYQTTRKFVKAHIVVTSNHPPDHGKLPNRFVVYDINPKDTVEDLGRVHREGAELPSASAEREFF